MKNNYLFLLPQRLEDVKGIAQVALIIVAGVDYEQRLAHEFEPLAHASCQPDC